MKTGKEMNPGLTLLKLYVCALLRPGLSGTVGGPAATPNMFVCGTGCRS